MQKLLLALVVFLQLLVSIPAEGAEPQIAVGLVTKQFTVEVSCKDGLSVSSTGNEVKEFSDEKIFVNAAQNSINFGAVRFASGSVSIESKGDEPIVINRKAYRGSVRIELTADKKDFNVVNILPLEQYLYSVVGRSVPVIFPDEAIKAQAVAARSLAYSKLAQATGESYAVLAKDLLLTYTGVESEKKAISRLVDATKGEMVVYNGVPIEAAFTVCTGGYTENSEDIYGHYVPYLRSVKDYDADAPLASWERSFDAKDVTAGLLRAGYDIGKLASIKLSAIDNLSSGDRTAVGRVLQIGFAGDKANVVLSGSAVKKIFALDSANFAVLVHRPIPSSLEISIENQYGMEVGRKEVPIKINEKNADGSVITHVPDIHFVSGETGEKVTFKGRGSGEGLGLSLWGAKGMADQAPPRDKEYYQTILSYYYSGTNIAELY